MRCDELIDRLSLLAYAELDPCETARCHEHLAECATCRAEWAAVRKVLGSLDQVPPYDAQLDLAAVCLRMAAREQRVRRQRRVIVVVASLAAGVLLALSLRAVHVSVEPGRMVLAWQPPPRRPSAPSVADDAAPGDFAQSASLRATAHDVPYAPFNAGDESDNLIDWASGGPMLAATRRNEFLRRASPGLRQAQRYAQPIAPKSSSPGVGSTYNELRREFLTPRSQAPDA